MCAHTCCLSPTTPNRHLTINYICTCRTKDNGVCVLAIPKGELGEQWRRLFRGDSDGARCMQPPYTLSGAAGPHASSPQKCCAHVRDIGGR